MYMYIHTCIYIYLDTYIYIYIYIYVYTLICIYTFRTLILTYIPIQDLKMDSWVGRSSVKYPGSGYFVKLPMDPEIARYQIVRVYVCVCVCVCVCVFVC